jgi:exodeoxyribonuclease-3
MNHPFLERAPKGTITPRPVLRIATWNVNSLRVRLPTLLGWLEEARPDVLALQETKVTDALFPAGPLATAGYGELLRRGERAYNGVALLARDKPFHGASFRLDGEAEEETRFLAATLPDGLRVITVYVPNGRTVDSPHFARKAAWLKTLRERLARELDRYPRLVVLGDFNIAPEERDVARPSDWEDSVLTHEEVRRAWRTFLDLGLHDAYRHRHPEGRDYTWWDYRRGAFARDDGLRIDHILLSTTLAEHLVEARVARTLRAGPRPSDHAPLVVDLRWD